MALGAFRAQVEAHARFFDHLVELVPAKHYVEREEQPANLKYLKKVRQRNALQQRLLLAGLYCYNLIQPRRALAAGRVCGRAKSSACGRWARRESARD